MKDLVLEGKFVRMVEITPEYFDYVIEWRNDPEKNKFLNCPEKLTFEKQSKWYNEKYLKDDTQGMLICINKRDNVPFGTYGWTDLDREKRQCILGRLMLGDVKYGRSPAFFEFMFLISDYLYEMVDVMYTHTSPYNQHSLNYGKLMGFIRGDQEHAQYPHELYVQGNKQRPQIEFYRTKSMYLDIRKLRYENCRLFN